MWGVGDTVAAYLGGRHSPDLVVVGPHEDIGKTLAVHAQDPLIEVLGLSVGNANLQGSVDQVGETTSLILLRQHGNVVLEGVGNPEALVTNVGDTLVGEPVILLGKSLVDAVVEVLVVREDDVTTDIVELYSRYIFISI